MSIFDDYFNHETLNRVFGIRLSPEQEEKLLDHVRKGFQRNLRKAVMKRIGPDEFEYVERAQDEEYLQSLLPDWQEILQAEIDWMIDGVFDRGPERIQRDWEEVA